MTIKDLINQLEQVENKDKYIHLLGNLENAEDESKDIIFNDVEVWDDGMKVLLYLLHKHSDELCEIQAKLWQLAITMPKPMYNKLNLLLCQTIVGIM